MFGHHWNLIDICVIEYVLAMDLKDKDNRVVHNYHLACFKLLTNAYQTPSGRAQMQDQAKSMQLVEFCAKSFLSASSKTVAHSAMCLFNHVLCLETGRAFLKDNLQMAMTNIAEVLA